MQTDLLGVPRMSKGVFTVDKSPVSLSPLPDSGNTEEEGLERLCMLVNHGESCGMLPSGQTGCRIHQSSQQLWSLHMTHERSSQSKIPAWLMKGLLRPHLSRGGIGSGWLLRGEAVFSFEDMAIDRLFVS